MRGSSTTFTQLFCSIRQSSRILRSFVRHFALFMSLPAAAAIRGPVLVSGGLVEGVAARDANISAFL